MAMRQLKVTKTITNRESPSLDKYLQEIGRVKLITTEEEVELARRIRAGDEEAKKKLALANLRFVVSVAKQYQNQGLSLPDLISIGNMGLMKAAGKFDETRGFKFISYAVWWIRQHILQHLAEQARVVRLPLNQVSAITKINKVIAKLEQDHERMPSAEEIGEALEMEPEKVIESLRNNFRAASLDAPLVEGGDSGNLLDLRQNDDIPVDMALMNAGLTEEVMRALNILTEREKDILKLFFGIGMNYNMTLDEIGQKFDLTRERVRQIKDKALRRLRHSSRLKLKEQAI